MLLQADQCFPKRYWNCWMSNTQSWMCIFSQTFNFEGHQSCNCLSYKDVRIVSRTLICPYLDGASQERVSTSMVWCTTLKQNYFQRTYWIYTPLRGVYIFSTTALTCISKEPIYSEFMGLEPLHFERIHLIIWIWFPLILWVYQTNPHSSIDNAAPVTYILCISTYLCIQDCLWYYKV